MHQLLAPKTWRILLISTKPHFLASVFMSQTQEVRVLMRPPIWSALPLFGSGTKTRIRVPAVIPKIGDTWEQGQERAMSGHHIDMIFGVGVVMRIESGADMIYRTKKSVFTKKGRPQCLLIRLTSSVGHRCFFV